MKAWKKAAIFALVTAGILVPTSLLIQANQASQSEQTTTDQFVPTQAMWDALICNAEYMMSRTIIVNDTAIDLEKVKYSGTWGIRETGGWCDQYDQSAVVIVEQWEVSLSAFESGTILDGSNAVTDHIHDCILFYHVDRFIASFIVG